MTALQADCRRGWDRF